MDWDGSLKQFSVNCRENSPADPFASSGFKLMMGAQSEKFIFHNRHSAHLRRRKYFTVSVIKKLLPDAFKMQNGNTYYNTRLSSAEIAKLTASTWE